MTNFEDAEYLTRRFSLQELRHEQHSANVHCLPDQDDYNYWLWFKYVIDWAVELFPFYHVMPKLINKPGSTHIDIESIRERVDIISLAENYGLKLYKSGHNFKALCPFHTDKSPSFYIYPDEKRFYCYGCLAKGDFIDLIMKLEGISFKEAVLKC